MTTLELPFVRAETPLPTWTKIFCALFFCSGFPGRDDADYGRQHGDEWRHYFGLD